IPARPARLCRSGNGSGENVARPGPSPERVRSHLLDGRDSEESEARLERASGHVAEAQAASAQRVVFDRKHRAALVEAVVGRRELVEVVTEPMRLERFADAAHDGRQLQELERERPLRVLDDLYRAEALVADAVGLGLAKNRSNADVRVLQVRCRVAVEREHAVPVDHIVSDALAREVGVLERADADDVRDATLLLLGHLGVLLGDDRVRALLGLVEDVAETYRAAAARLERLLVRAEDRAERHVIEPDLRTRPNRPPP